MMEMMRSFQTNMENQSNTFIAQLEEAEIGREERGSAPRIEKPATFSGVKGKDDSDLSTFLGQCENQFRVDSRAIGTDGAKIGIAISLLHDCPSTLSSRHVSQPPPPVVVDGDVEFELERILDSKAGRKAGLQYFVQRAVPGPEDKCDRFVRDLDVPRETSM